MRVLPDSLVRKSLSISRNVPVYYISEDVGESAVKKLDKAFTEESLESMIDKRPFDEVVLIMIVVDVYLINHITKDGKYRSFMYREGVMHNQTIRENFGFDKIDFEKDRQLYKANLASMVYCIAPFAVKKNVITLTQGKTVSTGKKGKVSKQKYVTVSNNIYTGCTKSNNHKRESFPVTSVAGHPMYYKKNPLTNGHDRKGNDVIGWTWRSPYKTGEGKEILNKIRLWK